MLILSHVANTDQAIIFSMLFIQRTQIFSDLQDTAFLCLHTYIGNSSLP